MAVPRKFMMPLTGSSLATLIVFIPLSFLSGVTGAFSNALSITIDCALVVSYLMTALTEAQLAALEKATSSRASIRAPAAPGTRSMLAI